MKQDRITSAITTLLVLLLSIGCVDKKSKQKLFSKKLVCDKIWREKFRVFSGGALSAELYSDYITDSVNFRVYVGSHDEYSGFQYECNGDTLFVNKFKVNAERNSTIIERSSFSLSVLQKRHKFE